MTKTALRPLHVSKIDLMQYQVLATDYDGTLATHGSVDEATIEGLRRYAAAGGILIMVTGRELVDLRRVFSCLDLFQRVVAENGAVLYDPAQDREASLSDPAPEEFVAALRRRSVPISVGRSIVATTDTYQHSVEEAIQETGAALSVILNKGSLMVLPAKVNKATGLQRALTELRITADNVVGIGDAENDLDFLSACGCGVAVANALPSVKSRADLVTRGAHGAGVAEIIDHLLRGGKLPRSRRASHFLVPD